MLLTSVLMMAMFVVTSPQIDASDEWLAMIENYITNQRSFGLAHPKMVELRDRIADATKNDCQLDLTQVQNRFESLSTDRKTLLRTRGLTHPDVVRNATQLSLMSRLLAGQSALVLGEIFKKAK